MAALATLFVFFVELWDAIKKPLYRSLLFVLAIILLLGMVFYRQVEGWSWSVSTSS